MRHLLVLIALVAISSTTFAAQNVPILFGGEILRSALEFNTADGGKVVEFLRKKETLRNWTKRLIFRYEVRSNIKNDPNRAAIEMGRRVEAGNPDAGYSVMRGTKEAMVDFITWPRNRKYVEFDVVRYAKSYDGKMLVSLQFCYRFSDTSPEAIAKFKEHRLAWLQEVAAFDLAKVHGVLAD